MQTSIKSEFSRQLTQLPQETIIRLSLDGLPPSSLIAILPKTAEEFGLLGRTSSSNGTPPCVFVSSFLYLFNSTYKFQGLCSIYEKITVLVYTLKEYSTTNFKQKMQFLQHIPLFVLDRNNHWHLTLCSRGRDTKSDWDQIFRWIPKHWVGVKTIEIPIFLPPDRYNLLKGVIKFITNAKKLIHLNKPKNDIEFIRKITNFIIATQNGPIKAKGNLLNCILNNITSNVNEYTSIQHLHINGCNLKSESLITSIPELSSIFFSKSHLKNYKSLHFLPNIYLKLNKSNAFAGLSFVAIQYAHNYQENNENTKSITSTIDIEPDSRKGVYHFPLSTTRYYSPSKVSYGSIMWSRFIWGWHTPKPRHGWASKYR